MGRRSKSLPHVVEHGGEISQFVSGLGQGLAKVRIAQFFCLNLELPDALRLIAHKQPHDAAAQQQGGQHSCTCPHVADASTIKLGCCKLCCEARGIGVHPTQFESSRQQASFHAIYDNRRCDDKAVGEPGCSHGIRAGRELANHE